MTAAKRRALPRDVTEKIQSVEKMGHPFRARGNVWRRVGQSGHFWVCDLILENRSFSDRPRKGYMLPYLEDIEPIEGCLFGKPAYPVELAKSSVTDEPRLVRLQALTAPGMAQRGDETREDQVAAAAVSSATEFKDWQYEPLRRVLQLPFPRLLIADDVGLGKTTEAGIIASHLVRQGQAERILVICPAHLQDKWRYELNARFSLAFEVFDKNVRHRLSRTGARNPWASRELVIVSMDFAKRWENLRPLRNVEWDLVIVDEAHHFQKTASGLVPRLRILLEEVCTTSPGLLLLTATPFRGGPEAVESLYMLLDPMAVERDEEKVLTERAKERRAKIMIRRLKRDVGNSGGAQFPERKIKHLEAARHVGKVEKSLIEDFSRFCARLAASGSDGARHLLVEVLRKRASSSWIALAETLGQLRDQDVAKDLPADFRPRISALCAEFQDAKSQELEELVRAKVVNEGEKIVIFTEFIPSLRHICRMLQVKFPNISFGAITGSECFARFDGRVIEDGLERIHLEEAFAAEENPVRILICTDAMSEGKDFQHACHNLCHYELPWSLVRMEQRNGRIDRFGQTKTPVIFNLILATDATPDQKILRLISDRIELWRKELGSVSDLIETLEEGGLKDRLLAGEDPTTSLSSAETAPPKVKGSTGDKTPVVDDVAAAKAFRLRSSCEESAHLATYALRSLIHNTDGSLTERRGGESGIFDLALPAGWELRGMEETFGYPGKENPWLVCFDAETFRRHEAKRRSQVSGLVSGGDVLHFLGPVHPIVTAAVNRFKAKIFASGEVPVLVAPDQPAGNCEPSYLLFEAQLCARGEKSVTLWRSLDTVSSSGLRLGEVTLAKMSASLRAPVKGDRLKDAMPSDKAWEAMISQAMNMAQEQAKDFLYANRSWLNGVRQEVASLGSEAKSTELSTDDVAGRLDSAKRLWIDELWEPTFDATTGEPAVRFLPLALILVRGAN